MHACLQGSRSVPMCGLTCPDMHAVLMCTSVACLLRVCGSHTVAACRVCNIHHPAHLHMCGLCMLAPYCRHFGDTYKWLLLGADNTVFFLPNVRKLLARFDSNGPWVISDHVTFQGVRPNLFAPRCLLCGFNASRIPPLGSLMQSFEHALMNVQSAHEAQHSERARSFKKTKLWQSYQRLQDAVSSGMHIEADVTASIQLCMIASRCSMSMSVHMFQQAAGYDGGDGDCHNACKQSELCMPANRSACVQTTSWLVLPLNM